MFNSLNRHSIYFGNAKENDLLSSVFKLGLRFKMYSLAYFMSIYDMNRSYSKPNHHTKPFLSLLSTRELLNVRV